MLRNGVDLLDIDRLARMQIRLPKIYERFIKRIYTDQEILEANGRLSYFAGRFAAKEATAKALQCGIGRLGWRSIEILHGDRDQPILHLHGEAKDYAAQLNINQWSVSISHTDTLAVAMVVMQS